MCSKTQFCFLTAAKECLQIPISSLACLHVKTTLRDWCARSECIPQFFIVHLYRPLRIHNLLSISVDSDQPAHMRRLIWVYVGLRSFPFAVASTDRCIYCVWFVFSLLWHIRNKMKWASAWQDQQNGMCAQRRLRSAWASAQSDQSLSCPPKEIFGPKLYTERTAKTLIRLGGCPGWSESLLGAHAILQVLPCAGWSIFHFHVTQNDQLKST